MNERARSFEALARSRRSIRGFAPDPVPRETIFRLLEIACQAPSAHNRQPWRFVVLERGDRRDRLLEALGRRFLAAMEADGVTRPEAEMRLERSQQRLRDAPWLVLLCLTTREMDVYPDDERSQAEHTMAVQSAALAGGHLLLAAHAEGLASCWMCAPLFAPDTVREELALPMDWEPQAAILLGIPAEPGRARGRRPVDEVTLWK
jgi:F420 biosynthesis protein FbiB-like protein